MSKDRLLHRGRIALLITGVLGLALSFFLYQESRAVELAPHLHLKAEKNKILGSKEFPDGEVKYAYKTNKRIDGNPSDHALRMGQEEGLQVRGERIDRRTKHSRTFTTSDPNTFVTEIISGEPQYYRDDNGVWWQADYATTTKEAFDAQTRPSPLSALFQQAFADTSTFYPDPNTETTTVDGRVRNLGSLTWSTVRDAATGDYASDSEAGEDGSYVGVQYIDETGLHYIINRDIFLFDTSSIGDGDTINSATFSVVFVSGGTDDEVNDANSYIGVVTSNPASNTALTTADFDTLGTTEQHDSGERVDLTGLTGGSYTNWTLNATGLGNISKTGVTKFGLREGHDINNSAIAQTNGLDSVASLTFADTSGTASDPKLVVVHTMPTVDLDVRKSANQSVVSTTALTTDSNLQLGLSPNKQYTIEGVVFASSSSATPDLKIGWNFPVGVTVDLGYIGGDDANYRGAELLRTSNTTSQTIPLAVNTPAIVKISGTVVVGNSTSTLTFLFAQATSDANPTTVLRGSYLRAIEIQQ
jgi:hypothetical protein